LLAVLVVKEVGRGGGASAGVLLPITYKSKSGCMGMKINEKDASYQHDTMMRDALLLVYYHYYGVVY
jgi:hypothetical protein